MMEILVKKRRSMKNRKLRMMKFLVKKKVSLSMSSAKPLGWGRGRGGPRTAPPRGLKPVNFFNNYFILNQILCNLRAKL